MKEKRNDSEISKCFVNEIWDNAIKVVEEKQAIKVQQNVGNDNIDVGEGERLETNRSFTQEIENERAAPLTPTLRR